MSEQQQQHVVTISYNDLVSFAANDDDDDDATSDNDDTSSLLNKIGQAFGDGDESLGILAVTDVPHLDRMRRTLLPMARDLALLPPSDLEQVIDESSGYQVGWSHGKEKVEGNKYDLAKGSFYANPLTDNLLEDTIMRHHRENDDNNDGKSLHQVQQVAKTHPAYFAPNVWPEKTSLSQFEAAFKELGQLVCQVGKLVARPCDAYVSTKCKGYKKGKLESVITNSMLCKARLLHYFAMDSSSKNSNDDSDDFSDWCGWHNDHGSLTGLVPAMFLDTHGNEVTCCPDPQAGLYIKSRNGRLIHVMLPSDSLGFQIGETSQIHTGGVLQATPHAVRGVRRTTFMGDQQTKIITRESFAVFMEPEYFGDMDIPEGKTVHDTQRRDAQEHLPSTVRTLASRWKRGMNFGEFSNATFEAFY